MLLQRLCVAVLCREPIPHIKLWIFIRSQSAGVCATCLRWKYERTEQRVLAWCTVRTWRDFFNAHSLAFCAHCRRVVLLCYSCGPSRDQNALFSVFYQNESISLSKDGGTCQNGTLTAIDTMLQDSCDKLIFCSTASVSGLLEEMYAGIMPALFASLIGNPHIEPSFSTIVPAAVCLCI